MRFEYRLFKGVVTDRRQWVLTLGRFTLSAAYLSGYGKNLRWLKAAPHTGCCARWSYCLWIYRFGIGAALDFVGLDSIAT